MISVCEERGKKWSFKFVLDIFCRKTDKWKCFPKIDISSVYLLFRLSQSFLFLDFITKLLSVCDAAWDHVRQQKTAVFSPIFCLLSQSDIIRNYPQPSPHLSHFIPLETAETITSHFHFITHHTLRSTQD